MSTEREAEGQRTQETGTPRARRLRRVAPHVGPNIKLASAQLGLCFLGLILILLSWTGLKKSDGLFRLLLQPQVRPGPGAHSPEREHPARGEAEITTRQRDAVIHIPPPTLTPTQEESQDGETEESEPDHRPPR
ncbi:MAG: hypothetical protein VYD19_08230 [Myxococcota bacterium]|nr:hypothetical protein [Myxococcota bacterium]